MDFELVDWISICFIYREISRSGSSRNAKFKWVWGWVEANWVTEVNSVKLGSCWLFVIRPRWMNQEKLLFTRINGWYNSNSWVATDTRRDINEVNQICQNCDGVGQLNKRLDQSILSNHLNSIEFIQLYKWITQRWFPTENVVSLRSRFKSQLTSCSNPMSCILLNLTSQFLSQLSNLTQPWASLLHY